MEKTYIAKVGFLIIIVFFISFFRLSSFTLFDVDEAVFSQATKEMIEKNNWITPTYNDANRYDKPIFFYWLMAASYSAFGINEFGARFPSALAGALLALAVFFFVKRFVDAERGFSAAIALVCSLYFFLYSHAAVTDMTLSLFISLSLFCFYLATEAVDNSKRRRCIYGFYACAALAFLTKGLIGMIFPFGIAVVYLLITSGPRGVVPMFKAGGVLVFMLIAFPWYGAQLAINGQEFIDMFFVKHHLTRYTGVISGHKGPFYYYFVALLAGLFPWIAFFPAGIREVLRVRKGIGLFALVWFSFVFIFFLFSTTKLPNYLLPAIPAAAIIIALGMSVGGRWRSAGLTFIAISTMLVAVAYVISTRYLISFGVKETDWVFIPAALMAMVAVVCVIGIVRKRLYKGALAAMIAGYLCVLSIYAVPLVNMHLQGTLHKYSITAREQMTKEERILVYGINHPSILFYSERRIIGISDKDSLQNALKYDSPRFAIAKSKEIDDLKKIGFTVILDDGKYALLERQ